MNKKKLLEPGKIAVLRESKHGEKRVSLTPQAVSRLAQSGFKISVETDAGLGANFSDRNYRETGANIVTTKQDLYQEANIIAWVKPPVNLETELSQISRDSIIIGLTNPFRNRDIDRYVKHFGLKVIPVELLPSMVANLPMKMQPLAAMSRFAGRIALQEALELHEKLTDQDKHQVFVLGAGQAGMSATRYGLSQGFPVMVASTSRRHEQEVLSLGGQFIKLPREEGDRDEQTLFAQQKTILEIARSYQPNVIIGAAWRTGLPAPRLFTAETISFLREHSIVIDLATSSGGNIEGSLFNKTIYTQNDVLIVNKSNYPNSEPEATSEAYATCLTEIFLSSIFNEIKSKITSK